mmetsp:Transcript_844/g.2262  ORF Transcript_844/g.2262 Transcript_844/m.2262 type:complete len:84 (+) Transcript_844:418-669(+)
MGSPTTRRPARLPRTVGALRGKLVLAHGMRRCAKARCCSFTKGKGGLLLAHGGISQPGWEMGATWHRLPNDQSRGMDGSPSPS